MKDTLLCLSGGLDSSSLLFEYKDRIAMAVTFDYGSRQNHREQQSAKLVAEKAGVPWKLVDIKSVFEGFKGTLLDNSEIPSGEYTAENQKSLVVPFRNGIFLSILAGLADSNGLKYVALASHSNDSSVYPDCRPEFSEAMSKAIYLGTDNNIEFFKPYIHITKREIAERGIKAGLNPDWTYSCYTGDDTECGKCPTCIERKAALDGMHW